MEDINVIVELIEHSGQVCKLFIDSEIALNDGDTAKSLKCNKEAQQLFSTMTKDIFCEIKPILNCDSVEVLDYDYPSVLELSKALSDLMYNASRLCTALLSNQGESIKAIIQEKVAIDINTSIEIYNSLFNN